MAEKVKGDIQRIVKQVYKKEKECISSWLYEYFSDCDIEINPNLRKLVTGEVILKDSGKVLEKAETILTYREDLPFRLKLRINPKYLQLPEELRNSIWAHEMNEAALVENSRLLGFLNRQREYFLIGKLATYIIHGYVDKKNWELGYYSSNEIIKTLKNFGF